MTDPFLSNDELNTGEYFKSSEHVGRLVLFMPKEYRSQITTKAGTSDAMVADATILDGPNEGVEYLDALVFGKAIVPALNATLRNPETKYALGRITLGEAAAGKNAPWLLGPVTEADKAKARAWIDKQSLTAPF